jgi:hypothetical protein
MMMTAQVSWVCGGYRWSTNLAWSTSAMPGTRGTQASTCSRAAPATTSETYKTTVAARVLARDMYEEPKIAVVVRDDLATWQKLNVTAFVVSGITGSSPDLIGLPYEDACGVAYLPMFAIPIVVLTADPAGMRRAFERARTRALRLGVYTEDLFSTGNDVDNRAAVARVATAELNLVGMSVVGERRDVDKALDRLRLHP